MKLQFHRMMTAPTVYWLLFLSLITDVSCGIIPFEISHTSLTATEGSCIEIKCRVTKYFTHNVNAHWFWIKDARWDETKDYSGTIVYSNKNTSQRPVSPDFKDRVKYTGSSSFFYRNDPSQTPLCSILICDLKTSDSGQYSFRYDGRISQKWMSERASLTVKENLCLVSFEKPEAVIESDRISLTCSTLSSCSSLPQIEGLTQQPMTTAYPPSTGQSSKRVTVTFDATWQDDGNVFSCQIENNEDKYLVRNISVTVEYAPRNTVAQTIPDDDKENDSVTLTCSSSGRPTPTFQWFQHGTNIKVFSGSEWKIPWVTESDAGLYYCEAQNKHGSNRSNGIQLDVKHKDFFEF